MTGTADGVSVITAKLACGTKTVKKTVTVTVKKPVEPTIEIADKPIDNTLSVGETFNLIVKATPEESVVSYAVDNEAIATVSTSGAITAKAEGTAVVTVTAAFEEQTVTKTLPITVISKHEDGITAEVTNNYNGVPNVVLVNQTATVKVQVTKDNKPVANKKVNFALGDPTEESYCDRDHNPYDIIGDKTQTTDANGYATFTIGNVKDSSIKATDPKMASFIYTLTTEDGLKLTKPLAFACIDYGTVENYNKNGDLQKYGVSQLEPSLNDKKFNTETFGNGYTTTLATVSEENSNVTDTHVDYVNSQQVSTKGEHKVKFGGFNPYLNIAEASVSDSTSKGVYFKDESVAYASGRYHTDSKMFESDKTNSKSFKLNRKPSELTYARLHFGTISLSKYTKLTIETFAVRNEKVEEKVDTLTITGPKTSTGQEYNIPLQKITNADDLEIVITLHSKDQVNLAQNDGFSLAYVEGVYQETLSQGEGVESISLDTLKVNWDYNNNDAQYNIEQSITKKNDKYYDAIGQDVSDIVKQIPDAEKYTIKYQVPSFPIVGNAIIRCYNANNKIDKYFVCPTVNGADVNNIIDVDKNVRVKDKYKNANVLDTNAKYCYEVSEKEATTKVGIKEDLVADGSSVTVDSKVVGVTFLKGTITDANGNTPAGFDDTNKNIYTFVQWCPVKGQTPGPQNPTSDKVHKGYLALTGQMIDLTAQLCDVNGNPVATKDEKIEFSYDPNSDVSNITNATGETDKNGRVTLTLQSAKATLVKNVKAKNKTYNVKLFVGPATTIDFDKVENATDLADLYWVDADLAFDASAIEGEETGDASTSTGKDIATAGSDASPALQPSVGQEWEYRIGTADAKITDGALYVSGKTNTVAIDGLKLKYETSGVGSFAVDDKLNVVTAKSEKNGKFEILGKVDNTSLNNSTVTFTLNDQTYNCVGSGNTNLNKRLTLKGAWQADGETIEMIAPNGTASAGNTITLYAKLTDKHANVISGQAIQVSYSNVKSVKVLSGGSLTEVTTSSAIYTDQNGLVKFEVTKLDSKTDSVVAVSDKTDETVKASVNISWTTPKSTTFSALNVEDKNADGSYVSRVSADGKKVILTFKDKVNAESVIAKEFTVKIGALTSSAIDNNDAYGVSAVEVNGKEVTLTINNGPLTIKQGTQFVVSVAPAMDKDGIERTMTDEYGRTITDNRRFVLTFDGANTDIPNDTTVPVNP